MCTVALYNIYMQQFMCHYLHVCMNNIQAGFYTYMAIDINHMKETDQLVTEW